MQLAHPLKSVPSQTDTVRQMINDSLLYDWVIRVEYVISDANREDDWQQWKAPLFALKSPQAVLDAISACCTAHPYSPVRLNAEKLRPRTSVVYWIHHTEKPISSDKVNVARLHALMPDAQRFSFDEVALISG